MRRQGQPPASAGMVGDHPAHMALMSISCVGIYEIDIGSRPCHRDMEGRPVVYVRETAKRMIA